MCLTGTTSAIYMLWNVIKCCSRVLRYVLFYVRTSLTNGTAILGGIRTNTAMFSNRFCNV